MDSHSVIEIPEELIDDIQFEIPEAPYDAIVSKLRESIISFCETSHYWQEEIDPVAIVADTATYELTTARSVSLVSVLSVKSDERNLIRSQADDIEFKYWQPNPFSIEVSPIDRLENQTFTIVAAVKPVLYNNSFKFSANLLANYRVALIAGAKSLLYKTPRKAWSDLKQAAINDTIFEAAAQDCLLMQSRGYSRLPDRSISAVTKKRNFY